jgi:sulfate adenylyltransferase
LNKVSILPHGGKLVNNLITAKDLVGIKTFDVSRDIRTEVENIAQGIFSPLNGFLNEDDLQQVLREGRLTDGTAWTIPIVFDVDDHTARNLKDLGDVVLTCEGESFGIIHVKDIYRFDKVHLSTSVYGTTDRNHPGVNKVLNERYSCKWQN